MSKKKVKSYLDPWYEIQYLHGIKRVSKHPKKVWYRLGKKKK